MLTSYFKNTCNNNCSRGADITFFLVGAKRMYLNNMIETYCGDLFETVWSNMSTQEQLKIGL